ncbi:MAG: methyltransferase domain-containing protein [Syntrophobacteraceae bacterium]
MKRSIIEFLICPSCLPEEIELNPEVSQERAGDIIEGSLLCRRCGTIYPVRAGIALLDPAALGEAKSDSKYETAPVLSSYLWSHFGDILGDGEASSAYSEWAALVDAGSGLVLDVGSAVGRFAFEMTQKSDFVVGIDNSVAFIRAARELMIHRRKSMALKQEGLLTREAKIVLPDGWRTDKVEFLVADALALPFRSGLFSVAGSLNIVDKVPKPVKHLQEMNRVSCGSGAQFLLSDPFSWSTEAAREEDWLGGRENGTYPGSGLQNIKALLEGGREQLTPAWHIVSQGHVWWKIRTHANHFELIRSCFVKARR